jgi:hypothetical protein
MPRLGCLELKLTANVMEVSEECLAASVPNDNNKVVR